MPETPGGVLYVNALYWTTTTLTTVGYGDVVPDGTSQQLYAIGTMVLGIAFFGYLVGTVAGLWARHDPARMRFERSVERLATAAKYARIPRALQHRIYQYHYYVWKRRLGYDEFDFLNGLPRNLRAEVSLHLKRHLIENGDLFRDADPAFVSEIALSLTPVVLTPGDTIFREGEAGREMFFIASGDLEVIDVDGTRIALMGPGAFFGEIALLSGSRRTATVRALTYCDLYALSSDAFERVAIRFPEMIQRIRDTAHARSAPAMRHAPVH
jgi:voltage-gated potassium channel